MGRRHQTKVSDIDESEKQFSGQLRLRIPSSLHRELAFAAAAEGVSLNQFMCAVLAAEIGWTTRTQENAESREVRRRENEKRRKDEFVSEVWRNLLR